MKIKAVMFRFKVSWRKQHPFVMTIKTLFVGLLPLVLLLVVGGCASRPHTLRVVPVSQRGYVNIEKFCSEHKFQYAFDTIDDLVRIYSSDTEIKMLLNTPLVTVQGRPFVLENAVVYRNGSIIVPRQLGEILKTRNFVSFRPLFQIKTIVIDPGHGGKDPGAISCRGLEEKTLNLLVAKRLKDRLRKQGYKVILTREKDIYLSLSQRVDIAKRHDADLFVSIHANANRSRMANGMEVYYLNPQRLNSLQRARKLAKAQRFQNRSVPADVAEILWDLVFTKNHSFSMEFANVLYYNFKKLGFSIRPPKTAGFHVLRYAYVPSVLLEIGYLTNRNEEKVLRSPHYQKQIAEAIALSINVLHGRYGRPEPRSLALTP